MDLTFGTLKISIRLEVIYMLFIAYYLHLIVN